MDHNKMCDMLSEEILTWAVARVQSEIKTEFVKNKNATDSRQSLRILQEALRQAADLGLVLHWKTFDVKRSDRSSSPSLG